MPHGVDDPELRGHHGRWDLSRGVWTRERFHPSIVARIVLRGTARM
jgi:hypothetical protein